MCVNVDNFEMHQELFKVFYHFEKLTVKITLYGWQFQFFYLDLLIRGFSNCNEHSSNLKLIKNILVLFHCPIQMEYLK